MDVDEDTSGYLEFIGEFRSLSNVIPIIIILSRMQLLILHFIFVLCVHNVVLQMYMGYFIARLLSLSVFTTWNGILHYLLIGNFYTLHWQIEADVLNFSQT
jgi:hypothetical protein